VSHSSVERHMLCFNWALVNLYSKQMRKLTDTPYNEQWLDLFRSYQGLLINEKTAFSPTSIEDQFEKKQNTETEKARNRVIPVLGSSNYVLM